METRHPALNPINDLRCDREATYSAGVATTPFHRHSAQHAPLQAGHQANSHRIRCRWCPPHSHSTPGIVAVPAACKPHPKRPHPSHTLAGIARSGGVRYSLRGGRWRAMARSVRALAASSETPVSRLIGIPGKGRGCADSGQAQNAALPRSAQWDAAAPACRNSATPPDA